MMRRFVHAEDGANAIEYALIAGGIGLVIAASIQLLGVLLNAQYVSFGGLFEAQPADRGPAAQLHRLNARQRRAHRQA